MTDQQRIIETLKKASGPLSDYGIYHAARSIGHKMTPSSVRTRRSELERAGRVVQAFGYELSPTGYKARVWTLV